MNDDPESAAPPAYKIEVRSIAALSALLAPHMDNIKRGWSLSASVLLTAVWACEQLPKPSVISRTFVPVDDVNDYDFLWRAGRCFRYNLVYGEMHEQKRWVLLELQRTA